MDSRPRTNTAILRTQHRFLGFSVPCCTLLLCALVIALTWSQSASATSADVPERFQLMAEDRGLALYLDPETTEIAVLDRESGALWFSNPQDIATEEKIARGAPRDQLGSQVIITYYTPDGRISYMNSLADSVRYGQASVSEVPGGVQVVYEFGQKWTEESYLPIMISQERFDELILKHIENAADRKLFLDNYMLVSLELTGDVDKPSVYRFDQDRVFGDYNLVLLTRQLTLDRDRIALIENLVDQIVEHRHDYSSRSDITRDDVSQLINTPTYVLSRKARQWDIEDMITLLKSIGYTPEDAQQDHLANHIDPPYPNPTTFVVGVEYRLDNGSLVVRIPVDQVTYPMDVPVNPLDPNSGTMTAPIHAINVLPYFGAANMKENGYIFIPDGCGALINHNNGKLSASPYRKSVYGRDDARESQGYRSGDVEQIYLPVFGLMKNGEAFITVIERGEALAEIVADIAGRTNSYNTVSADFVVIPKGVTTLQGEPPSLISWQIVQNTLNVYQSRIYDGDITLRYMFLSDEEADYVGMAQRYRDYLLEKRMMEPVAYQSDVPFFLDIIGGVPVTKPILGVPREIIEPLTTYSQAESLVDMLSQSGIANLRIRYRGWMDGGMNPAFPRGVALEAMLGSKRDFEEFLNGAQRHGSLLFLDVDFLTIGRNSLLDGLVPFRDAARSLNRRPATAFSRYNPATLVAEGDSEEFLVSPGRLSEVIDNFLLDYQNYAVGGISLTEMGWRLYSDFWEDPDKLIHRVKAQTIMTELLHEVSGRSCSVMLDGANAYVLPYANSIVDVPLSSSAYKVIDCDVPFLQIVLHGFVEYAGEPLNLVDDYRRAVLRMVEFGASPRFAWTASESSALKGTDFDHLYSVAYTDWFDTALHLYERLNSDLSSVFHQPIVYHGQLSPYVFITEYSDGTAVVVNYRNESVEVDGVIVGGMDFAVLPTGGRI